MKKKTSFSFKKYYILQRIKQIQIFTKKKKYHISFFLITKYLFILIFFFLFFLHIIQ